MRDRERLIAILEKARTEAADTIRSMNGGFAAWYADKLLEAGVVFRGELERDIHGEQMAGKWIPVPSSDMAVGKAYKCSNCKRMRYGMRLPPYCQECGSKMNGDSPC